LGEGETCRKRIHEKKKRTLRKENLQSRENKAGRGKKRKRGRLGKRFNGAINCPGGQTFKVAACTTQGTRVRNLVESKKK